MVEQALLTPFSCTRSAGSQHTSGVNPFLGGGHPGKYLWEDVLAGQTADVEDLWLRDDEHFRAGGVQDPAACPVWDCVLANHPDRALLLGWLENGVNLDDLWVPYRGRFQLRQVFDSARPQKREFPNYPITPDLTEWVDSEVAKGLETGAFGRWDPSWCPGIGLSTRGG